MTKSAAIKKTVIVALVVALIFPAAWIAFTGSTYRTPVVEKSKFDQMSDMERQTWIAENSREVGLVERIVDLPSVIAENWLGYLKASLSIFIVVFILNGAYLLGGINKP